MFNWVLVGFIVLCIILLVWAYFRENRLERRLARYIQGDKEKARKESRPKGRLEKYIQGDEERARKEQEGRKKQVNPILLYKDNGQKVR